LRPPSTARFGMRQDAFQDYKRLKIEWHFAKFRRG
jgi:hypothetical protein